MAVPSGKGCSFFPGAVWWKQSRFILSRVKQIVAKEGLSSCGWRIREKISRVLRGRGSFLPFSSKGVHEQYQIWLKQHQLTQSMVLEIHRELKRLAYRPLLSLVITIGNAHEEWLREAMESVRGQFYTNWELWIIGVSSISGSTKRVIEEYRALDPRIKHESPAESALETVHKNGFHLASGEFVCFLGQHDELAPDALLEVIRQLNERPDLDLLYSDEDTFNVQGQRVEPFFKPDWSPDLLLSVNYLAHSCVFRRSFLLETAAFEADSQKDSAYDLILQFTEKTDKICHIPKVLYHSRQFPPTRTSRDEHERSPDSEEKMALERALQRRGEKGHIEEIQPGRFRVSYQLRDHPLVSIIIPTRDRLRFLERCIGSIEKKTQYPRYEIIVLDNESASPQMQHYLERVAQKWRVCRYSGPFNFSAINNYGASHAHGEYLLFLNDDTEVVGAHWLTAMMGQAQRHGVGIVGAKLLYPNGTIQHAGVVLGICGGAGHAFRYGPDKDWGYHGFAHLMRNCSAVTGACMLIPRWIFDQVQGFDIRLPVEYNDVDLCLRVAQKGHRIVYTPEAVLYHYESATRRGKRSHADEELFRQIWGDRIQMGDPYYNPNLTLSREDWSLRL